MEFLLTIECVTKEKVEYLSFDVSDPTIFELCVKNQIEVMAFFNNFYYAKISIKKFESFDEIEMNMNKILEGSYPLVSFTSVKRIKVADILKEYCKIAFNEKISDDDVKELIKANENKKLDEIVKKNKVLPIPSKIIESIKNPNKKIR